jgi:hypothetical protein
MNKQLGSNENRKCDEDSDMHFNITQEGKPTDVPRRGAEGGEK